MTRTSQFVVRFPERTQPDTVRTQLVSAAYFSRSAFPSRRVATSTRAT